VKIVVDTNIVFSAILSSRGKIGELLLNKPAEIEFLSPKFLLDELTFHTKKIISLTGFSETEYQQIKAYVIQHIEFIDSKNIAPEHWERSFDLIKEVDENDIPFLALTMEVNGLLWTGDKKLIKALQYKKFDNVVTTDIIYLKYFGL
jgi:predicted nucleic acid-binding protein